MQNIKTTFIIIDRNIVIMIIPMATKQWCTAGSAAGSQHPLHDGTCHCL